MFFILVIILLLALILPSPANADSGFTQDFAGTPYDLIDAVNALRLSNGLAPYSISSILMSTAQDQANFMAATGTVTHSGPGGIGLTDRLLAAGYPLAGDLSLGGFRAENITGGSEGMSAQAAVDRWTGDAPHLNTMLSPNLTEIGAGVALAGGRVYYVIDAARPTTSGEPQDVAAAAGEGAVIPAGKAPIPVVALSTPNAEGDVIHEVMAGQSLWQIAIAYDVRIDDIKRLNPIFENNIYPGDKLLIRRGVMLPTGTPTKFAIPTVTASTTPTIRPVFTPTRHLNTAAPLSSPVEPDAPQHGNTIANVIGILAIAILGGGVFAWLGSSRRE